MRYDSQSAENERARSAQEEKRAEEREVLIKVVTELWSEDKSTA